MKEFRGVPASPGFAIGKAYLYNDDELLIPEYSILEEDVSGELHRYKVAVERAVGELEVIKSRNGPQGDPDGFLDTHILMLRDPELEAKVDVKLAKIKKNVEWILQEVVSELVAKLSTVQDVYLKERTMDIKDVSRRVLQQLLGNKGHMPLSELPEEVIVVTPTLLPSDAVAMNKKFVKGLAMDAGGKTTHTAILARSFEIPAVLGTVRISHEVKTGDLVIVDGETGVVFVNPEPQILKDYQDKLKEYESTRLRLSKLNSLPCETLDHHRIQINANIEIPEELEAVHRYGADGIGLYRSEFLFIKHGAGVSETIQFEAYRTVLQGMENKTVTIRTLDLGGDKLVPDLYPMKESNPLLGWRAVRFCLADKNLFRTQLRALLRASVYGNLKIMFPMISGVGELERVLSVLEEVKSDLKKQKVPFTENIPIGTMIEVPSAALVSDHLAQMVDFFSIGTNDLTQYTLAVDRGNERIAELYEPFHPGVLRLIKMVIDNAHNAGISVAMCGEMAGDPKAALLLTGLGLDEFSMNAVSLPNVKEVLRALSVNEARQVVDQVLRLSRSEDILSFVDSYLKGRFTEIE